MSRLAGISFALALGLLLAYATGCASSDKSKQRSRNDVYWGGGSKHADSFPGSHRRGGLYRGRPVRYRY